VPASMLHSVTPASPVGFSLNLQCLMVPFDASGARIVQILSKRVSGLREHRDPDSAVRPRAAHKLPLWEYAALKHSSPPLASGPALAGPSVPRIERRGSWERLRAKAEKRGNIWPGAGVMQGPIKNPGNGGMRATGTRGPYIL
jgi:hypothetical protein